MNSIVYFGSVCVCVFFPLCLRYAYRTLKSKFSAHTLRFPLKYIADEFVTRHNDSNDLHHRYDLIRYSLNSPLWHSVHGKYAAKIFIFTST